MNPPPPLSLGVPVYNGAAFLAETLESLLAQTCGDFELIISDNASGDDTEKICRAYAARDARIRYYRQEQNRGAAWNYNFVFRRARGAFFKWNAADDVCAPELLEKCLAALEHQPEAVLCYPKTVIIDAYGEMLDLDRQSIRLSSPSARGRFVQLMHQLGECNAVFGVMRAEVLRKTRLIGNYIASDVCLLAELSLHGNFLELPEYLFFRRDHPAASSRNKSAEQQMEFFDPGLRTRLFFPKWRRLRENFHSVWRAPLPLLESFWLWGYLGYSLLWGGNGYGTEIKQALLQYWRQKRNPMAQSFAKEHEAGSVANLSNLSL